MIRKFGSPSPNIFENRGPRVGSKRWAPRSAAGQVGALIFGTVYVAAGLPAIVTTVGFRYEIRNSIALPALTFAINILAVSTAFAVAFGIIFLGSRMLLGAFRTAPDSKV
jgi:hypothetical protein